MAAGLSASLLSPPRRRVLFLWGSSGSARLPIIAPQSWLQRPQTLMNNPTHRLLKKKFAQEQRRQQKRSRRGLGRYLGALRACGLSNRAGCPQRAGRWRAHMPQQHLHCKNLLQNGGSVSAACARGPFLREDAPPCAAITRVPAPPAAPPRTEGSLRRLGCHFARFRHTHRSLPFACERFAGSATQPDYCETRPLGVRVAGQERLSGLPVRLPGTALRYGS